MSGAQTLIEIVAFGRVGGLLFCLVCVCVCVCVLGGKVIWYSLFFNCIWGLGCGVLTELFAPFYNFVDRWVNIGVYI